MNFKKLDNLCTCCNEACLILIVASMISGVSLLNITMHTSNINFIVIVIIWINLLILLTFVCCSLVCIEHNKRIETYTNELEESNIKITKKSKEHAYDFKFFFKLIASFLKTSINSSVSADINETWQRLFTLASLEKDLVGIWVLNLNKKFYMKCCSNRKTYR